MIIKQDGVTLFEGSSIRLLWPIAPSRMTIECFGFKANGDRTTFSVELTHNEAWRVTTPARDRPKPPHSG